MRRIISFTIAVIISTVSVYAQNQNNSQDVELPDFVIVGKAKIQLPTIKKNSAIQLSTLSEDFTKAEISTDDLQIAEISSPIKQEVKLFENPAKFVGVFDFGLGFYNWPYAKFTYGSKLGKGMFNSEFLGINEKEYVNNAGVNTLMANVNYSIFIDKNYAFLPNTNIEFSSDYNRFIYKYYEAPDTAYLFSQKRENHRGGFALSVRNLTNENFKYTVTTKEKITYLKDYDIKLGESDFNTEADMNFNILDANFEDKFAFKLQTVSQSIGKINSTLFTTSFGANRLVYNHKLNSNLIVSGGIYMAGGEAINFFIMPHISTAYRLNEQLSLFLTYTSNYKMLTMSDILLANRYAEFKNTYNLLTKEINKIIINSNYEIDKYIQIYTTLSYSRVHDQLYFNDIDTNRIFEIGKTKANVYNIKTELLFHNGPFGMFYGSINLNFVKQLNGKYLPYYPVFNSSLSYKYNITNKLDIEPGLTINVKSYSDIENNKSEKSLCVDLNAKAIYHFAKQVDLFCKIENIVNHKNYYYNIYREKPFDILVGLQYRW